MSTITVTNIKATGETASRAVSGVAAVWCNFNGTGTIAIRDSVNVASLTDNGVGRYSVNISNAFTSTNYAPNVTIGFAADTGRYGEVTNYINASEVEVGARNSSGTSVDNAGNAVAIHGDLA